MLVDVCKATGRSASELTRRDVVSTLLTKPAEETLADLPVLRRDLMAAGNPLSSPFWVRAESVLTAIRAGNATIGDVQAWLEATGTEPIQLIPDEMFVWPDKDERGPVAAELHDLLVAHLEELVAKGTIDPDRLVVGDAAALSAYEQVQRDWLNSPLPDGRVPFDALADEESDKFLQMWADEDRDAMQILGEQLEAIGQRRCPEAELSATCARLRDGLASDDPRYRLLRAAAGADPTRLPSDDRELWLTLASGVVAQREDPPDGVLDDESLAAWATLVHADWIAAAVVLARSGPGAFVNLDELAQEVAAFDFEAIDGGYEAGGEDGRFGDDSADSFEDDTSMLTIGMYPVLHLWRMLGVLDDDDRLTALGWWGIPESMLHAWKSDEQS